MSKENRGSTEDEKRSTVEEAWAGERSSRHGRKGSAVGRSLIISPNLDALLEYEERQRGLEGSGGEGSREQAWGQQEGLPSGLPPPPRGMGRRLSKGPRKTGGEVRTSSSNPYINPAPTFESCDGSDRSAPPRSPSDAGSAEKINSQADAAGRSFAPQILSRIRSAKGRLARQRRDMEFSTQPQLRPRTLIDISHRDSLDSLDSMSTHGPASTVEHEPRISISSTVYPASSAHSHPISLYNHDPVYEPSFIEFASPANPDFFFPPHGNTDPPLSPIQFSGPSPLLPSFPTRSSPKPPIPTTPKPMFIRPQLKASPRGSPTRHTLFDSQQHPNDRALPPTTNFLDLDERADLVRKARKLARVFGQTPGADAITPHESGNPKFSTGSRPKDAGSASTVDDVKRSRPRPRPDSFVLRRHSMPLTPDDVSFLSIVSPRIDPPSPSRASESSDLSSHPLGQIRPTSPTSFMDLSDDDAPGSSSIKPPQIGAPLSTSPNQSVETMSILSVDDRHDDDRRRKRERLAKLHRFLGSRVPANLVLGIDDLEASLPPPQDTPASNPTSPNGDETTRKAWLRRRRSRSVTAPPSRWSEDLDRVKDELDEQEKALNVRRAQKMEKVFGVAPPLTLYHTRHCPSPSTLPPAKALPPVPVISPLSIQDLPNLSIERDTNPQPRTAYPKTKAKKNGRPGTSESNKQLLPQGYENTSYDDRLTTPNARHSLIYTHYQHSLNSLNDILDRDDRESLAELHQYLNSTEVPSPSQPEDDLSTRMDRRLSIASTIKSERRRSLPARTSLVSLASSEFSVTTPKAEITTFQVRRRRAAKLTQFFGVNYRELVNDVLESIENGVEHEHQKGTLRAEEVEDLLSKLRSLKTKRQGLF